MAGVPSDSRQDELTVEPRSESPRGHRSTRQTGRRAVESPTPWRSSTDGPTSFVWIALSAANDPYESRRVSSPIRASDRAGLPHLCGAWRQEEGAPATQQRPGARRPRVVDGRNATVGHVRRAETCSDTCLQRHQYVAHRAPTHCAKSSADRRSIPFNCWGYGHFCPPLA